VHKLKEYCANLPPGRVADSNGFDRLLAEHWNRFSGDDGKGSTAIALREDEQVLVAIDHGGHFDPHHQFSQLGPI
jgi:hypothetical protein